MVNRKRYAGLSNDPLVNPCQRYQQGIARDAVVQHLAIVGPYQTAISLVVAAGENVDLA